VIEGARHLPWLELAARDNPQTVAHLRNCETCKMERSVASRQEMGCGFEPPSPFALPWRHPGYEGEPPTVCPGYTTALPEAREIAWAHWHSERQSWRDVVGARAHPHLIAGIEIFAAEVAGVQRWEMKGEG
jgi:hypothetical protein